MPRTVMVTAPSRLHFGMLSFGRADVRQFGGVGVMIDAPGMKLQFQASDRLEAHGPLAERALGFARHAAQSLGTSEEPRCHIDILSAPRGHVGLGVGTQLGLSVAAGLNRFLDRPDALPAELARLAGRGRRSAVGTYGFAQGGMIVESGKREEEAIAPLLARTELPSTWRFVLICPAAGEGLSGGNEQNAFVGLPPVADEVTDTLCREILLGMLPAARQGNYAEFGASLYRFGYLAGMCFAARQGGAFANDRLAGLVEAIRAAGVEGVGQSSWGPTLFALLPDQREAARFVERFRERPDAEDLEFSIAAPDNRGARIEVVDPRD